eukprot:SAG31_NODE_3540_length_4144_cov_2.714957_1_plen_128_part_00
MEKSRPQLFEIIAEHAPEKTYEVFEIASEYGHTVRFTPPYCHRSAPIEIFWANVKRPLARRASRNINHLMTWVKAQVSKIKESTLLGAYADARQWEDEMFLRDEHVTPGDAADSESESDDEDGDDTE